MELNSLPSTMSPIFFHFSREPDAMEDVLHESLASGRIDPQLHYLTPCQAELWTEVHRKYSPAWSDDETKALYGALAAGVSVANGLVLVSLGCGAGNKDANLLKSWAARGCAPHYLACDTSLALVETACAAARAAAPGLPCLGAVADLGRAAGLDDWWRGYHPELPRVFAAFGLLPNFDAPFLLRRLAAWLRPGDRLLISANLAPEEDYEKACRRLLGGYDNAPTRRWLAQLPADLGIPADAVRLDFDMRLGPCGCRFVCRMVFQHDVDICVHQRSYTWKQGAEWELFFSHRPHPGILRRWLEDAGMEMAEMMISNDGEEGVFQARRRMDHSPIEPSGPI